MNSLDDKFGLHRSIVKGGLIPGAPNLPTNIGRRNLAKNNPDIFSTKIKPLRHEFRSP